MAKGIFFSS